MNMTNKLTCIKICNDRFEAEMIKNYLAIYEIDSIISSDNLGRVITGNYSARGVKILVKEEDAKRASEILESDDFKINSSSPTE
ncbi:MAG: DUF2007 domain-containing protein [Bacteroidetes bacterium]|nr:DUF2007 domain-containing protein [Bacteroidota bacterium]